MGDDIQGGDEYEKMLLLEELESLLEEMDEGEETNASERAARLRELGIANRDELAGRISSFHADLDTTEV